MIFTVDRQQALRGNLSKLTLERRAVLSRILVQHISIIMNGFVVLSFSTLVNFLCHILDQGVRGALGSLHRDLNKTLTYAVFKDHLFHDLDVPFVDAATVETERKCLLRCVKHYQCFSANIAAFPRPGGHKLCVLLSTDKYSAPEKFRANHSFHHYSIVVTFFLFSICSTNSLTRA